MTRDEIHSLIRDHLAAELEINSGRITDSAKLKDDLGADSLHLVELAMELEDRLGVKIPADVAIGLESVGQVVDFCFSELE